MLKVNKKVSVIVVCWKRFENLQQILENWLDEPEVSEVILWDNSGQFSTDLPIVVINSNDNFNPSVRYLIGTMAKNDLIIHCDDDILPKKGIVEDFLRHHQEDWFSSIEGMFFTGNSFFNQKRIHGKNISAPQACELVIGNLTMIDKKFLFGHDYLNFSKYQLEMCLQHILKHKIKPMVIPSTKYEELPECKDENALHLDADGRNEKEDLYERFKNG
jgi:hypothetical protein